MSWSSELTLVRGGITIRTRRNEGTNIAKVVGARNAARVRGVRVADLAP